MAKKKVEVHETYGSLALKPDKKRIVTGARYDRYTIDDVLHYHEDIAMMQKQMSRKGIDAYISWERSMCLNDLYYLLLYVLDIKVMWCEETDDSIIFRPWIFNRCREVQESPDYHIDIWAREHFKSTIITLGKTIQDILSNPEIAVGIFSYNVNIAEAFVRQIRTNLELPRLRKLFPDIIPSNTTKGKYKVISDEGEEDTVKFQWSDKKFTLIRKTRRKEPTVAGYGLINAQPVGMHFDLMIYDDVVTPASVLTQTQNDRTTYQFKMSLNTGSGEGVKVRIIGTYYALRDTYFHILNPHFSDEGVMGGSNFTLRRYPCINEGVPVLYTEEYINRKRISMVGYVFASQMMCDPQESDGFRFLEEWIPNRISQDYVYDNKNFFNFYIIVDPAYTKTNKSDNTAMVVIATTNERKYIVADIIRDKLTLSERRDKLFYLVKKWENDKRVPLVFYEANSASTDITSMEEKMRSEDFYFTINPVSTKPKLSFYGSAGNPLKYNRIVALEPILRERRIIFCENTDHMNWNGVIENMTQSFIENEYLTFPFSDHDDVLDAISRIADLETGIMLTFPESPVKENNNIIRFRRINYNKERDITQTGYNPFA